MSARVEQVILPWTPRPFPSPVSRRSHGSAPLEVEEHAYPEARTTWVSRQVLEAACQMPQLVCCLICEMGLPPNHWEVGWEPQVLRTRGAGQSCRPGASHILSAHRRQPLRCHRHRLPQTLEGPQLAEGPADQRGPGGPLLSMNGNEKQALPGFFFASFFLRF